MDFPGGAVVKTTCRGLKIQSLVRELRSRMPHGAAKKKKKKRGSLSVLELSSPARIALSLLSPLCW